MPGEGAESCRQLREAIASGDPSAERLAARVHGVLSLVAGDDGVPPAWRAFLEQLPTLPDERCARRAVLEIAARSVCARAGAVEPGLPGIAPERFAPGEHPFAGGWLAPPTALPPELDPVAVRRAFGHVLRGLPDVERVVVVLRDVEGWSADDVRRALALPDTQQRTALHRARVALRSRLESELAARGGGVA